MTSPSLKGVRVVRGPDWKWGDQDGGLGYAGTVIDIPEFELKEFGPRTVTVVWDSGTKGQYRAGPKGSLDLRIIDNTALGVKHPGIRCAGCKIKEILGTRWQCAECDINLCTNCFLKEVPHHQDHKRFKRYDDSKIINNPPTVSSWNENGPESRIQLLGFYPGAKVVQGSNLLHDERDFGKMGLVLPNSSAIGEILVKWSPEIKRTHRLGHQDLQVREPGIGGLFHPDAFCLLESSVPESPKMSVLHSACKSGDKELVQSLLMDPSSADIEEEDVNGLKAIHYAVKGCQPEVLEILMDRNVKLDSRNRSGQTALHVAVSNRYTECARMLIQRGCDVNLQDSYGDTPIHYAIYDGGAPNIIRMLVTCGRIDWKLRNQTGFNVLHLAVLRNDFKAVEIILENADEDLVLERIAGSRSTVLHYACFHRNYKMAELLVNWVQSKSSEVLLQTFLECRNNSGRTAFLIASEHKDFELLELLVNAGTDVRAIDREENSAIMIVVINPLPQFPPPSRKICPAIYKDKEFCKIVKEDPCFSIIGYLLDKGCDWNQCNDSGTFPSSYLERKWRMPDGHLDVVERFAAKYKKNKPSYNRLVPVDECLPIYTSLMDYEDPLIEYEKLDKLPVSKTRLENTIHQESPDGFEFEVVKDGNSMFGFVLDQFGNKYKLESAEFRKGKQDIQYRCIKEAPLVGKRRCPAVVQMLIDMKDESNTTTKLQTAHQHPMEEMRDKRVWTDQGMNSMSPTSKKRMKDLEGMALFGFRLPRMFQQ